eukprot:CCRYP_001256-RB/>CCRYP_001256-RB protein AED:0.47 eAED:0.93 QI:0/0/0/1/0/0/2/0/75
MSGHLTPIGYFFVIARIATTAPSISNKRWYNNVALWIALNDTVVAIPMTFLCVEIFSVANTVSDARCICNNAIRI